MCGVHKAQHTTCVCGTNMCRQHVHLVKVKNQKLSVLHMHLKCTLFMLHRAVTDPDEIMFIDEILHYGEFH